MQHAMNCATIPPRLPENAQPIAYTYSPYISGVVPLVDTLFNGFIERIGYKGLLFKKMDPHCDIILTYLIIMSHFVINYLCLP